MDAIIFERPSPDELSQGTDLIEVTFKRLNLEELTSKGANLKMANLERADLERAQHLSLDQLSKVKTLHDTKLDKELLIH